MEPERRQIPVIFEGVFDITAGPDRLPGDEQKRDRYSSYVVIRSRDGSFAQVPLVVIPEDGTIALVAGSCYFLRGFAIPPEEHGDTFFYPTARSAMVMPNVRSDEILTSLEIKLISRGRVVQCRHERNRSRWWLNILHGAYSPELNRYVSFEMDYYMSSPLFREAGRATFTQGNIVDIGGSICGFTHAGHRWAANVCEAELPVPGPLVDFWLMV